MLFDMDQTKPLFRSRDLQAALKEKGIAVHYEEQKADAPTMVGGVVPHLTDPEKRVVLDVGGGEMGARFIGGIAQFVNAENTIVFCVINPYRPWSGTLSNIDRTLTEIVHISRIKQIHERGPGPQPAAAAGPAAFRGCEDQGPIRLKNRTASYSYRPKITQYFITQAGKLSVY